jgi:hypothetical protein
VRQEQHEPGLPQPLGLRPGEEGIDDHLCTVGKVPKLRLPDDLAIS